MALELKATHNIEKSLYVQGKSWFYSYLLIKNVCWHAREPLFPNFQRIPQSILTSGVLLAYFRITQVQIKNKVDEETVGEDC